MKRALCLALTAGLLLLTACGKTESAPVDSTVASSAAANDTASSTATASKSHASTSSATSQVNEDAAEVFAAYADALAKTKTLTTYRYSATTAFGVVIDGTTVILDGTQTVGTGDGADFDVTVSAYAKDVHNKQLSSSVDHTVANKAENTTVVSQEYTDLEDTENNSKMKTTDAYAAVPLSEILNTDFSFSRADVSKASSVDGNFTINIRADAAAKIIKKLFDSVGMEDNPSSVDVSYFVVTATVQNNVITQYRASVFCTTDDNTYSLDSRFSLTLS